MVKPVHLHDLLGGPERGTMIAKTSMLPSHGGLDVTFQDGQHMVKILVQRLGGDIYVYENSCPHALTPLNLFDDRFMDMNDQYLICRTHGALFKPSTGECVQGPCIGKFLRCIAVKITDDVIYSD